MNPTDQARKEARRRELKKNKKQRIAVRQAVIKTKDPNQMIKELEDLDNMELDPTSENQYNEKVCTVAFRLINRLFSSCRRHSFGWQDFFNFM